MTELDKGSTSETEETAEQEAEQEAEQGAAEQDHSAAHCATTSHAVEQVRQLQQGLALESARTRNPVLAALIASGQPFIRCNRCGFVAASPNQQTNQAAADDHSCVDNAYDDGGSVVKHIVWAVAAVLVLAVLCFTFLIGIGRFDF